MLVFLHKVEFMIVPWRWWGWHLWSGLALHNAIGTAPQTWPMTPLCDSMRRPGVSFGKWFRRMMGNSGEDLD